MRACGSGQLVGEEVHEQAVVPRAVGAALVAAQHADLTEAELAVGADRPLVVDGRVDREAVVVALVDQPAGGEPQRRRTDPAALVVGKQRDVDVRVLVVGVELLLLADPAR